MTQEQTITHRVFMDAGKYQTKALIEKEDQTLSTLVFPTKMDPTEELSTTKKESFVVTFNGNRYLLGRAADTPNFNTRKDEEIQKISAYTAIANFVPNGAKVSLIIGMPAFHYQNIVTRTQFADFFKSDKNVEIIINEQAHHFEIAEVKVLPESYGTIVKNVDLIDSLSEDFSQFAVVEIGGLNQNLTVYDGVDLDTKYTIINNEGTHELIDHIRGDLEMSLNMKFDLDAVEKIIRTRTLHTTNEDDRKKALEIVHNHCLAFCREIITSMDRKNWNKEQYCYFFSGGGANLVKQELQETFSAILPKGIKNIHFSENSHLDNVIGYYFWDRTVRGK